WNMSDLDKLKKLNPSVEIVYLSNLGSEKLDSKKFYIVINDTFGKMNVVNRVADVNVTAGPVNIFEPLLAQTPAVFFDAKSPFIRSYDPETYKKMADVAVKSGGGFQ